MKDFILIDHTADLQLHIFGTSLQELFINAMRGLFHVIGPHIPGASLHKDRFHFNSYDLEKEVEVSGGTLDILLVNFLSELLYLSDVHNCAFFDGTIHFNDHTKLTARVFGKKVTRIDLEVKAVTYHDAWVKQEHGEWQASIVFDI